MEHANSRGRRLIVSSTRTHPRVATVGGRGARRNMGPNNIPGNETADRLSFRNLHRTSEGSLEEESVGSLMKAILAIIATLLVFSGVDCKHNPVGPPPGPDTTSNNFTFQTYTFGGNAGSCYLQDVTIINDTDIWAVGAIYLDSADGAPDPFPYNAVHWDGNKWNVERLPYNYQGQAYYSPVYSILAFSSNDIWFEAGIHWDGHQFNSVPFNINFPSHVNRMWGTSDNDFYIVGNSGLMYHYTSGTWTKITTGTDLSFDDIYGAGGEALAVAYDAAEIHGYSGALFSILGNNATQLSINPIQLPSALYGVWFVPDQRYYIVGEGVYEKRSLSDTSWTPLPITGAATTGVDGNDTSDVFIVSSTGDFLHWNGARWTSFRGQTGLNGGGYSMVAVKGNTVIAVGENNPVAVITMARRQ